jgi:hypothetical protein
MTTICWRCRVTITGPAGAASGLIADELEISMRTVEPPPTWRICSLANAGGEAPRRRRRAGAIQAAARG